MDWWPTFARLAGLQPPPRQWKDNNGNPIIFDGVDLSEPLLGTGPGKRETFAAPFSPLPLCSIASVKAANVTESKAVPIWVVVRPGQTS